MKINEISDEEKVILALKNIRYDFIADYSNVMNAYLVIGKSSNRRQLLKNDIDEALYDLSLFLDYGFDMSDPDILLAKDIQNKLLDIKNKL